MFWSISLAGTSSIKKSFWQGGKINTNGMLHFLKSADCPRNDKGIIKVAGGNFKTLFLVGSKKKKFKMDLFKRCHISYLQASFRLKGSKIKRGHFFFPPS